MQTPGVRGQLLDAQMSFGVAGARDCRSCGKWAKCEGFCSILNYNHRYSPSHDTTTTPSVQQTVFFDGERHDLSKTEVLAKELDPRTFYERHPEDHAPAPSVQADFWGLIQKWPGMGLA